MSYVVPSNAAEILRLPGVEIAAAVRSGALSAVEVLETYLARIDALNPRLRAIVFPLYDEARARAREIDAARRRGETLGLLAGVPVTVKDSFDLRGAPTTIGLESRVSHRAEADSPVVARLRQADAVLVGKTNVPQLMLMFETDNRCYGRTLHPENPHRGAGGSSGGEAAAIAARFAAVGLGSDLLGSIRQPAHVCGVHGFKPTMNRTSMAGSLNALRGMEAIVSQAGPLARHVVDATAFAKLLLEEPYDDPFTTALPWRDPATVDLSRLRIGVWDDAPMFQASPAVRRAVREAADVLRGAGAEIVPFAMPDAETAFRYCIMLLAANGGRTAREMIGREKPLPGVELMLRVWGLPPLMRPAVAAAFEARGQKWRGKLTRWARACSAGEYWQLLQARKEYVRGVMQQWRAQQLDVILAPPHGLPALRHGTATDVVIAGVYSFVANLLGVPAGTVAATRVRPDEEGDRPPGRQLNEIAARLNDAESVGLPVGVQVLALHGRDDVCLAVMQALETEFAKRPDYPPNSFRDPS